MDVISCLPRSGGGAGAGGGGGGCLRGVVGKNKIPLGLSIHSRCSCTWSVHSKGNNRHTPHTRMYVYV